jgi:hypothetical protein
MREPSGRRALQLRPWPARPQQLALAVAQRLRNARAAPMMAPPMRMRLCAPCAPCPHQDVHLLVQPVAQHKVVRHGQPVRLHRVVLPEVELLEPACGRGARAISSAATATAASTAIWPRSGREVPGWKGPRAALTVIEVADAVGLAHPGRTPARSAASFGQASASGPALTPSRLCTPRFGSRRLQCAGLNVLWCRPNATPPNCFVRISYCFVRLPKPDNTRVGSRQGAGSAAHGPASRRARPLAAREEVEPCRHPGAC